MRKSNRYWLIALLVAVVASCAGGAYWQYYRLRISNLKSKDGETHRLYVYPNCSLDSVLQVVAEDYDVASMWSLRLHCRLMKFQKPRVGAYLLPAEEGSQSFIQRLRGGLQTPVEVKFNNVRTREQLAKRLGEQLLLDSIDIITRLESDTFMAQYGLKKETAVCLFIPNTYSLYWNISADEVFHRMREEYNHFWTAERDEKARALHLSREAVATIASICEEENNKDEEYPTIAGLYINRLRKGMHLQSCPTVKFALQNFGLRRILYEHLQVDSPYNTYKYAGLPPGPIRIPKASTMDAVLNSEKHEYLYMCASADFKGYHHFSKTYKEHARYAKAYQKELNKRKI